MLDIKYYEKNFVASTDATTKDVDYSTGTPCVVKLVMFNITAQLAHNANPEGLGNGVYKLYDPRGGSIIQFIQVDKNVVTPNNTALTVVNAHTPNAYISLTQTTAALEAGAHILLAIWEQA